MYIAGVLFIAIGLMIGGMEAHYLLTNERGGNIGYDWAAIGLLIGSLIALLGLLLIYLGYERRDRRTKAGS